MPNRVRTDSDKTLAPSTRTCYLLKDLYDCIRNRPFNKPFSLQHEDGSVDEALKTEQDMKNALWRRKNPFLQRSVVFKC